MQKRAMTVEEVRALAAPKATRRHGRGIKQNQDVMNDTERAYAAELEQRKRAGEIHDYRFHGVTLLLADPPHAKGLRWTCDFAVWTAEMVLEFHDVKGRGKKKGTEAEYAPRIEDHSQLKLKMAAAQFPHPIVVVYQLPKKLGGGWQKTEY